MSVWTTIDDFVHAKWTEQPNGELWSVLELLGDGQNKYWFGPMRRSEVQLFIAMRRAILGEMARRRLQKQSLAT
jgi:hypothetical protein